MEEKTEKAQTFKEGNLVVIVEASPKDHNGKVAIYLESEDFSINPIRHLVMIPNLHRWVCLKIRHATLLEKELAEC